MRRIKSDRCLVWRPRISCYFLLLMGLTGLPGCASAFYAWQSDHAHLQARGLIRGSLNIRQYMDDPMLFPESATSEVGGIARLMVDAGFGESWGFELNAYRTYLPANQSMQQSSSVERSAAFDASYSESVYAHLALDRLALRWSEGDLDLTIGRQPVNLATTFYFTPNDFFAPFAAQTFYRVYKPGVDAMRAEIGLGELSQLSLISVLGYAPNADSATGWSNSPDMRRTSWLMRWSDAFANLETIVMVGHLPDKDIIGGALQGDLFEWLGIRMEGHHADSRIAGVDDYQQFSLGIEHRWESDLDLRAEFYYNGLGNKGSPPAESRRYSAVGGSYQLTPLLMGEAMILSNLDDQSHLLSMNGIYSLSNEADLSMGISIPAGRKPAEGIPQSEFGSYPKSINLEFRLYF